MVIAVTGAHGFLGGRIVERAVAAGHEVTALGRPAETIPSPEFRSRLADCRPDAVVHAAGTASVARSMTNPELDRAGSVDVLDAVLRAAMECPDPPRVSMLSSAAVYGQPDTLPVREDAAIRPLSPYGRHRAECEERLASYHETTAAPVVALRVFSAYGEGLRRQLLWDIAQKARGGGQVDLGGSGAETRDFVHAGDVAEAVLLSLADRGDANAHVNVASGVETSIRVLATELLAAMGHTVGPRFSGEPRPGDPDRWCADIARLEGWGFRPAVELSEGLRLYASWVVGQPA